MHRTFWQFVEDYQPLQDRSACDLPSDNCEERNEAHLLELHSWGIRSQQEQYTLLCPAAARIVDNTFDGLLMWFATLCCIRLFHKLNQLLTHPTPMLFTVTSGDCVMEFMIYVHKLNLNKVDPLCWTDQICMGLQASLGSSLPPLLIELEVVLNSRSQVTNICTFNLNHRRPSFRASVSVEASGGCGSSTSVILHVHHVSKRVLKLSDTLSICNECSFSHFRAAAYLEIMHTYTHTKWGFLFELCYDCVSCVVCTCAHSHTCAVCTHNVPRLYVCSYVHSGSVLLSTRFISTIGEYCGSTYVCMYALGMSLYVAYRPHLLLTDLE